MDATEIRKAVLGIVASIAPEGDVGALRPEQPLRRQIDLDSMDWQNVLAALSERLAIDIPEADAGTLETLDAIVAFLAARLEAGRHPAPSPRPEPPLAGTRHVINGIPVTLRPMRADDLPLEAEFVRHLSLESRYDRFMVTVSELPAAKLKYLTDVDQSTHVALVATTERDTGEEIVGVVRYIVGPDGTSCEFAIAIADGWHRSGLAGILMRALIDIARARGLRTMEGFVLAANAPMLRFARQLGFQVRRDAQDRDTLRVVRDL